MRKITLTAEQVRFIKGYAGYGWPVEGDPSPYDDEYHGEGVDWALGCPNEVCCPCCGCMCFDYHDDADMDDWLDAEDVGKERWYDDEEV